MHGAVGRQLSRRVSFPVSQSDIRRWALAVYCPERLPREFVDADYAATRLGGFVAPQEFNPFAWMVAEREEADVRVAHDDPDLTEIALCIEGPHLKFQPNGALHAEYGLPMQPGDVITSVNRLAGYHERAGRLGLMLFTVTEDVWTNQRGERVKRTRETLIRY
jgi:hypothetical protein